MIYRIIIALLFVIQCFSSVWYFRAIKPGFSKKTLLIKIFCSSVFVLTGVMCVLYSGGFTSFYGKLIVIGLCCSWIGDVLLHKAKTMPRYITGGLGFLIAHVLYITAFTKSYPGAPFITKQNIIIMVAAYLLAVVLYFACRLKAGKLLIPIMIYAVALCFMLSKAVSLGIYYMSVSQTAAGILLILGASLFVVSDFMLGISFLGNTTYKKQVANMAAYFPAQMLLALSICFIK